jgi:hypothetical protein
VLTVTAIFFCPAQSHLAKGFLSTDYGPGTWLAMLDRAMGHLDKVLALETPKSRQL